MSSTLNGLIKSLTWSDFPPPRNGAAPHPGHSATAAYTDTSWSASGLGMQRVSGASTAQFKLSDTLTVNITFRRNNSYVMKWLFQRSVTEQNDMLNHEQGHYNVTALIARDFFVDLMLMKTRIFTSAQTGQQEITNIQKSTVDKIATVQQLYDNEVHPEQSSGQTHGPVQRRWDNYFNTAFTQARASGTTAPNGTPHKVRLIDVLVNDGKTI